MTDQTPTQRLRESIDLRNLSDPRIEAMVNDVRGIRTEIRGLNQIGNLALGNSREAVDVAAKVFERLTEVMDRLGRLEERMEKMAQLAKTKGW